MQMLREIHG
jgi:hypothetical protein